MVTLSSLIVTLDLPLSFIGELKLNGDAQLADRDAQLVVELRRRAEA